MRNWWPLSRPFPTRSLFVALALFTQQSQFQHLTDGSPTFSANCTFSRDRYKKESWPLVPTKTPVMFLGRCRVGRNAALGQTPQVSTPLSALCTVVSNRDNTQKNLLRKSWASCDLNWPEASTRRTVRAKRQLMNPICLPVPLVLEAKPAFLYEDRKCCAKYGSTQTHLWWFC